jgi:LAO/AO transport system kinase
MEIDAILSGDAAAAARLMRAVEDGDAQARGILPQLMPSAGRAHIIGITGVPGAGKSTLTDRLIAGLRHTGSTVGVVAVDPSSPLSGGAILGDRVRMQRHTTDPGVFIRSLANRGQAGGLSRAAHDIVLIMDAMGKDVVLVETVGVGQDGVAVMRLAQTCIVVTPPGGGDGMQAVKAGILEVGHIFVVNKADREGAHQAAQQLELVLGLAPTTAGADRWRPPVVLTSAVADRGTEDLLDAITAHRRHCSRHPEATSEPEAQLAYRLADLLLDRLRERSLAALEDSDRWRQTLASVRDRHLDIYTAADQLADWLIKARS